MIPDKECCSQYLVKIVIPVYKVDLNIYETVSLNQAVNVFKNYTKRLYLINMKINLTFRILMMIILQISSVTIV